MTKYGFFVNPSPTSLSDLVNDNNYMVIREYTLDPATLKTGSAIAINDIKAGSTITKVSLNVKGAFKSSVSNPIISVVSDSGKILMNSDWNDPTIVNNYSTDCYYVTSGNTNELVVSHNITNPTSGLATLRIELYENLPEYTELQTQSGENYITTDSKTVEVTK